MLIALLQCEDCQKEFQFEDVIEQDKPNISKDECEDYEISLIKKLENNDFECTVIVNCKKCDYSINNTFTEKETNFHFTCNNCNLKGLNFNYFLSIEEDNKPQLNQIENDDDINKMRLDRSTAPPIIQEEFVGLNLPYETKLWLQAGCL